MITGKLNDVLEEAKARLLAIETTTISLVGRVVIAYNEDDLIALLKGIRSFPAVGIVYEGMRSQPEAGATGKLGLSAEIVVSFVLVEADMAVQATDQKRTRAIDYLEVIRGTFMGERSTVTGHFWHFLVEAPAEIKTGAVVWVQRWTLPVQLPKRT